MKIKKCIIIIWTFLFIFSNTSTIIFAGNDLVNRFAQKETMDETEEENKVDITEEVEEQTNHEVANDATNEIVEDTAIEEPQKQEIPEEKEQQEEIQQEKAGIEDEANDTTLPTSEKEIKPFTIANTNAIVPDGIYTIASALNANLVLDVSGSSTENEANVALYRNMRNDNQLFKITYTEDGYYTIQALHSNKMLDVHGAGKQNETNVEQYQANGNDNQKWQIQKTTDGYYAIISKCNGLYLDAYGGRAKNDTNIQVYQGNNGLGQKFLLKEKKPVQGTKTIEDGTYKIASAINPNFVLDVNEGSTANDANIQLYYSDNGKNQRFKITYLGNGYYTIEAVHSGKMLDVCASGRQNETNVEQYASNNGDNQKWVIQEVGGSAEGEKYYSIISKCNDLYLDVYAGRAQNGTNIQMYEGNNGLGQKFVLKEIEQGREIEDGTYKIASALDTNLVLDVVGKSQENEANVQINTNGNGRNQRFHITYVGEGYYTIEAEHSGKMLNVAGAGTENETNVEQQEANQEDSQKWQIKEVSKGYYCIISKCNGLYLDVYGGYSKKGTNVQMYEGHNTAGQRFVLRKMKEGQTIEDGTYKISTAMDTNAVLDVSESSLMNGANVALWRRNNNNNQKFKIEYDGYGYYTIQALHSGKNLDVHSAGTKNETNVEQYTPNGADNQKWEIKDAGNEYFYIVSKHSGLYLDICGGKPQNGANLQIYEKNGGDNQKFSFDDQYYGIDVSKHQGDINFAQLSGTGIDFMIIRSGYGRDAGQEDAKFQYNYNQAKAYGIPVGTYWYSYAQTVEQAKLEAYNCLKSISGKSFELPVFFDIEDPSQANIDTQTQTDMCLAFCEIIKSAGFKKVGIYTGKFWLRDHIDLTRIPEEYRLWIASYGKNTGEPEYQYEYTGRHEIWQYTSQGSIAGVNGCVDMNVCYERFF